MGTGISEKPVNFFCKNENLDANDDGQKGTRGGGRQTAKMPAEVMMVTQIMLWILGTLSFTF